MVARYRGGLLGERVASGGVARGGLLGEGC